MSSVVVHYGELALKGRNRPWFMNTLVESIRSALARSRRGRRPAAGRAHHRPARSARRVGRGARPAARLPGIGNFARAIHVAPDLDAIASTRSSTPSAAARAASFRVTARRADKRFPGALARHRARSRPARAGSDRLARQPVGSRVTIRVEVLTTDAFFFFDRQPGAGGLPDRHERKGHVPAFRRHRLTGRGVALIRRGCRTNFVHFHSYPILVARLAGQGARARRRR